MARRRRKRRPQPPPPPRRTFTQRGWDQHAADLWLFRRLADKHGPTMAREILEGLGPVAPDFDDWWRERVGVCVKGWG